MTDSPLDDDVARQYERFPYPQPAASLEEWNARGGHFPDPQKQHLVFWPDRGYPHGMEILVAGCGANQAANIAYHNPTARVLGIDVSTASLASQQRLKDRHGLANLELRRLPIEEVGSLGRDFDLILSTGVLHHMADPELGMRVLGGLLRRDGVFAVMLYARHGWHAVRVMWDFFHRLRLDQSAESVALIRETFRQVQPTHPIRHYMDLGPWDLDSDSGVIDSFLHPRAQTYSVPDILRMVEDAGLVFQGWMSNYLYYPECMPAGSPLYRALGRLPERELWAAMELFYALGNATHYFHVCRPERPRDHYVIDFAAERLSAYVPVPAPDLQVVRDEAGRPARLSRRGIDSPFDAAQATAFALIDGKRSIGDILGAMRDGGVQGTPEQLSAFAQTFFRSLWRLELIYIGLPGTAAGAVSG